MSLNHKANKDEVDLAFRYHNEWQEYKLNKLKAELATKEKFNVYTQRVMGEIMELLIKRKIMTNQEAFIITSKAKRAVFTIEELHELQKIANKGIEQ